MPVKTEPFDVGDIVTVEIDFSNAVDAPTNPTDVTVVVRKPDGTTATHPIGDLANPTPGAFTVEVSFDQPGVWVVRGAGSGTIPLVRERRIRVRPSEIT